MNLNIWPLQPSLSQFWGFRYTQPSLVGSENPSFCILSHWSACPEAKHIFLDFWSLLFHSGNWPWKETSTFVDQHQYDYHKHQWILLAGSVFQSLHRFADLILNTTIFFIWNYYINLKMIYLFIYFYLMILSTCLCICAPWACNIWGSQ